MTNDTTDETPSNGLPDADAFDHGDELIIDYREERPPHEPGEEWHYASHSVQGRICALPSRKFDRPTDAMDFDIKNPNDVVFSVNLDNATLYKIHYDAGGDRDFDSYPIESITLQEWRTYDTEN